MQPVQPGLPGAHVRSGSDFVDTDRNQHHVISSQVLLRQQAAQAFHRQPGARHQRPLDRACECLCQTRWQLPGKCLLLVGGPHPGSGRITRNQNPHQNLQALRFMTRVLQCRRRRWRRKLRRRFNPPGSRPGRFRQNRRHPTDAAPLQEQPRTECQGGEKSHPIRPRHARQSIKAGKVGCAFGGERGERLLRLR